MTNPLSQIKKHQKMQVAQAKYYSDMIEARQSRASSAAFRHHILEKQKIHNYTSEYDRLRAHLEDSALPFKTREHVKARTEKLKSMGAKAVQGIF